MLYQTAVIRHNLSCQPKRKILADTAAPETSILRAWQKIAQSHWEHFPHEAGTGVSGFGTNREQAFEQVARVESLICVKG
jgi:hypothetical protein